TRRPQRDQAVAGGAPAGPIPPAKAFPPPLPHSGSALSRGAGLASRPYSNNYSTMATTELRLSYSECRELLQRRLAEPAPGRVQLLTGPRQVGKTTLLLELAGELGDIA